MLVLVKYSILRVARELEWGLSTRPQGPRDLQRYIPIGIVITSYRGAAVYFTLLVFFAGTGYM